MMAGDEVDDGGGSVGDDGETPVVGGEEGRTAGVPHTTAHLKAAAASGGDDGSGAAARLASTGDDGGLSARGGGAMEHGRGRERGQTKEDDEVVLYIALD